MKPAELICKGWRLPGNWALHENRDNGHTNKGHKQSSFTPIKFGESKNTFKPEIPIELTKRIILLYVL